MSHNQSNEGIYYEIVNIETPAMSMNTTASTNQLDQDTSFLNQIVKLDIDDLSSADQRFDTNDDLVTRSRLNSISQQQKASCSSYFDAAIASTSSTTTTNNFNINCNNSNHNNNSNLVNKQLSRNNSSTFSSKSHYSMRSSMTKGTGGGGGGGGGGISGASGINAGSVSLSITTASNYRPNLRNSSKEQEIISQQQQQHQHQQQDEQQQQQNQIDRYSIESTSNLSIYSLSLNYTNVKEPIIIRGAGNITIFGVCNKFNEQFPSQLNAKLAPEEFNDTIKQINQVLSKELANSFRWLVFGSIFCCCTLGISLLPVIFMNKKAKLSINKLLDIENQRLYLKLGLKWKLTKMKCNSNSLTEYVLLIEILPTILLYQPD